MVTTDKAQQLKKVLDNLKIGTVQEVDESQFRKPEETINAEDKNQSFVDSVAGVDPERAKQSHLEAINQIVDDEKIGNPTQALAQDPQSKPLSKQNDMGSSKIEKPSIKKEIESMKKTREATKQKQIVKEKTQTQKPKTKSSKIKR